MHKYLISIREAADLVGNGFSVDDVFKNFTVDDDKLGSNRSQEELKLQIESIISGGDHEIGRVI